jgi:Protein of unknown function (DUF3224)
MKKQCGECVRIVASILLCFSGGSDVHAQGGGQAIQKEGAVANQAVGTFEVKVTPAATDDQWADPAIGRMLLDKQFHGDLEGTSKGQMLTAAADVKGSGAYVAIEKVCGTLKGRKGTFLLQHSGTMKRSATVNDNGCA